MSSARCLNWSRPPPGRHPAAAAAVLRKQVSCIEHSSSSGSLTGLDSGSLLSSATGSTTTSTALHRPSTVNTLSNALVQQQQQQQQQQPPPADGCDHFCQFLVTGAIIHTNRFQNYHTYNQAHRGACGSGGSVTPLPGYQHQQPSLPQRRRPSSASAAGGAGGGVISVDPATTSPGDRARLGRRAILCKQLSLDQSILVAATAASSIASGMAAVANAGEGQGPDGSSIERGWGFGRKQGARIGTGNGMKSEMESGTKKGPKAGKDSRINIKIFLGQTVQQDSSDTGISDTEAPTPTATTTNTATAAASLQKSDSTPAMSSTTVRPSKSMGLQQWPVEERSEVAERDEGKEAKPACQSNTSTDVYTPHQRPGVPRVTNRVTGNRPLSESWLVLGTGFD
ncbi:hypothetical protein AND_002265 [Anopheles darlingi]|uniref:Uncharacterized protein n=1 Tax=Anopheles darlingi TaxID=43151 RepID=W5JSS3_ANODA|nr:hypothetical protein AND_002265 [Anopheles darlingi]